MKGNDKTKITFKLDTYTYEEKSSCERLLVVTGVKKITETSIKIDMFSGNNRTMLDKPKRT
jgi:hypothetical protein